MATAPATAKGEDYSPLVATSDERATARAQMISKIAIGIVIVLFLALSALNCAGAAGKIPVKTLSILNVTLGGALVLSMTTAAYTHPRSRERTSAALALSLFLTLPWTLVGGLGIGGMCGLPRVATYGLIVPGALLVVGGCFFYKQSCCPDDKRGGFFE